MLLSPSLSMSSSSSMSSSLSSRLCFNNGCSEFKLDHFRPGWRLRSGDFADLCDRCAYAYEQGKFCDIFHLKALGWRCCESCGKRIHCGCIVSASAFMLLDAGGVECLACARKKVALGPNFSRSPSFFFQPPIAEKFTDFSGKTRSYSTGLNQISCRPSTLLGPSVLQFDLHNRGDSCQFSQPTSEDTLYSLEKRGVDDLMGRLISENLKCHTGDRVGYQKAGPDCKLPPVPNLNVYPPLTTLNDGPSETQFILPVPSITPIETNGHSRLDRSNLLHAPSSSPLNYLHNDLNGGAVPLCESESQNLRPHLEAQRKYQVVPRYWPGVLYNSEELAKESKSVITPLFEKMLSASDTGRIGRLVLPKKCAEAFLPKISHPEGLPLKVQDSMGNDWTFQFRFWPNNNSRMYVLEGVTACMQSMQLQAGDTVVFSRLDPEEKLIMGCRKASVAQSSEQENDSANKYHDASTNRDVEPGDPHSPSRVNNSAFGAKDTLGVEFSTGKRSSTMNVNSKRQKVEKGDLMELKLTWEEAQGFLLPPPNFTPSIIVIDGIEFEEYEDCPIIGKPTVCDTDDTSFGPTCSVDKELEAEQNEKEAMEEVEELPTSPKTTTKHPRHKSSCTCIVCIQYPKGKGRKHEQWCSCTVCEMVKRRTHTMLLRREKNHIEAENTHKELQSLNSDDELHQYANNNENTSRNHKPHEPQMQRNSSAPPLKGQIDLNIQPEKDDESLSGSEVTTKTRFMYLNATVKSSFDSPSSSTAYTQTDKEDEAIHKTNTGATDTKSPA